MKKRPFYTQIWDELSQNKAMIFMAGPRQAGKTTLSHQLQKQYSSSLYFNWDIIAQRQNLIKNPLFFENIDRKDPTSPLIIFDEIHKYPHWKNYLKGVYDQFSKTYQFLVLGSGRLNVFQKGGDSLAGRYFLTTIFPFTLAEFFTQKPSLVDFLKDPLAISSETKKAHEIWDTLFQLSGFPEPFLSSKETHYHRWARTYAQQLIREDIRNMTAVRQIDLIEILFSLLPSRVGSPLSIASLARDLQVAFNSVSAWLNIFDSFFLTFRVQPWAKKISRAITKEKKLYLYDYAKITSHPDRFENMIAIELLRATTHWSEMGWGDFGLYYLREKDGTEVDFLICQKNKPLLLIEAKWNDAHATKQLIRFQDLLQIPAVQLVQTKGICRLITNKKHPILIISAAQWLCHLP